MHFLIEKPINKSTEIPKPSERQRHEKLPEVETRMKWNKSEETKRKLICNCNSFTTGQ